MKWVCSKICTNCKKTISGPNWAKHVKTIKHLQNTGSVAKKGNKHKCTKCKYIGKSR